MIVRLDMSGELVECLVPETAAEVLDFRVRIRCIDDADVRLGAARQWFLERADGVPIDADGLPAWPSTEGEELPGSVWLFAACETLISHAALSDDVVDDIVKLEDRKNDVPPDWQPQSKCDCVQCRWDPDDGPMPELPPEHTCMFDDIDPRAAHVVATLAGAEDLTQPFWAVQALQALKTAEWRRFRYREEQKEIEEVEGEEFREASAELGSMLRGS